MWESAERKTRNPVGVDGLQTFIELWLYSLPTHAIYKGNSSRVHILLVFNVSFPMIFTGVGIFAILRSAAEPPRTLLVIQFRPAVGKKCVEFPAGEAANQTRTRRETQPFKRTRFKIGTRLSLFLKKRTYRQK